MGSEAEYRILVPIADYRGAGVLMRLASGILRRRRGKAIALGVVEVPEGDSLSEGTLRARVQRRLLKEVAALKEAENIEVKTAVRISHQAWQGIQEVAAEERADLLILGWKGESRRADRIFGTTIDALVKSPPCDLAVVRARDLRDCRSILLPIRGGPHAELALQLALALAEAFGATVDALHVEPLGAYPSDTEGRLFSELVSSVRGYPGVTVSRLAAPSVEEAILAEGRKHQLIIMGAAILPDEGPSLFGAIPEAVAAKAEAPVMVVKTREPVDASLFQPSPHPVSVAVDKWFAENTFLPREFRDIDELIALKGRQGLTVSLALLSLNEETTVRRVIDVVKEELMERKPLIDELALIDGGSTDGTVAAASDMGVTVYQQHRTLAQYGPCLGKGDALWKSLYLLRGDIIAWLDTCIRNIHPKFVYMLVGPLLKEERLQFVKGFYGRPHALGENTSETGGNLIAELTCRPLLNLFFPELSGVVEPLGGECAGRRQALEEMPFDTGFGVEVGLLIDIWSRFGLGAIGQSDLEERVHREWPLASLSPKALALVRVMMRRLEGQRQVRLLEEAATTMKHILLERERFSLQVARIGDAERPPMVTIAEYRERRGLPPQ